MEIYGLRCTCHPEDGVRYVGRTANTAVARLRGHKSWAARGGTLPVHAWIRKHGADNIYFEILAVAQSHEELARLELEWIERLHMSGRLLNVVLVEQGIWTITDEHRAKLSAAGRGRKASMEARANISAALRGRRVSLETRAKLSAANRDKVLSDETREKIAAGRRGVVVSNETRMRMSEAQRGRVFSDEHKTKLSAAARARKKSA